MASVAIASVQATAVSTTAVRVVDGSPHRAAVKVKHVGTNSTGSIFLGPTSAVSTSNGYDLSMRESEVFESYSGEVWAIANVAASPLRSWETG